MKNKTANSIKNPTQESNPGKHNEKSTMEELDEVLDTTGFLMELRHPSFITLIVSIVVGLACLKINIIFGLIAFLITYTCMAYLVHKN